MEINAFEGFNGSFFNVVIGGADENCGWTYRLKPGETYTTTNAFYGVVKGGFEEAVRELTAYKRKTSIVDTHIEVAFNDFMNCYWAQPSADRLIPLIDKAAELGVQTFCIDDGWSKTGEWDPLEEKFGEYGLKGIIAYIRSKGMRAGVWFEFETTTYAVAEKLGEDVLLKRDGRLIAKHRPKLDLRNKKAREWLLGKIDHMYDIGVRYIKNDHNNDEKWGTNYDGESPAEGLRRKTQAVYDFIEELHARYPDLVIENCGAGAMRQDHGTLKRFSLQSTSDQEDYRLYPSILVGAMACLPPEKAGIWGYPYPLLYKNIGTMHIPEEELAQFKDGRETVFNMVSAMCGYMYLSGRLDLADDFNTQLIKEAIEIYKGYKDTISNRYPAFILPMKPMADKTYNAFGLIDADKKDMILAVWALEEIEFTLDLSKYAFAKAEILYPLSLSNAQIHYAQGLLDCKFNEKYSAILIKLS
jgi:alpha-galactosidase